MQRRAPLLAAAIGAILAPAAAAQPVALGGYSVRPAEFDASHPQTRAFFEQTVRAGTEFTGHVVISNGRSTPLGLRVYPVDGLTGRTSGAVYGNAGDPLRAAGAWLTPGASEVTLPGKGRRLVSFTVHVPAGALPGDHLAGIAVQDASPVRSPGRFSVVEVWRVVVGVEITVPGPAPAAVALTGAAIEPLAGTSFGSVVLGVVNRGRRLCKPRLTVSLTGSGRALTVTRRLDTMLPGDLIFYPLPWRAPLERGTYAAAARATGCGAPATLQADVFAGRPLRGALASESPQLPHAEASGPGWVLMLAVATGVIAGLLARGAVVRLLARGRRRHDPDRPPAFAAAPPGSRR